MDTSSFFEPSLYFRLNPVEQKWLTTHNINLTAATVPLFPKRKKTWCIDISFWVRNSPVLQTIT
jgi:hypothetical protein